MASFFKDLMNVGLSNFAIIIFGLGRAIITARWLGPKANGIIAVLSVYPALFMSIGSLGIQQSTTYFIGKKIYSEKDIKTSVSQIWFITSIISMFICFFLIKYFSNSCNNIIWIIFSIIPIPFNLFTTYNSGIYLGKNQIQFFNKINWLPAAIGFVSILFFVVYLQLNVSGVLISAIIGPALMFFLLLFKNDFIRSFSFSIDFRIVKSLLALGMIYAVALLIINLNVQLDILILDKLSTPYETGIYSKGVAITQYLWYIPMLLSTIIFARSANAKDDYLFSKKVAQLLRVSIILVSITSLILILTAKYIILGMFGIKFYDSISVLRLLLPGILLLTIFKCLNQDLAGKGKPWISMKAMIPALLINIILNYILIPNYGASGAAISTTISYSFATLIFLYIYSKEVDIKISEIFRYSIDDFLPITNALKRLLYK